MNNVALKQGEYIAYPKILISTDVKVAERDNNAANSDAFMLTSIDVSPAEAIADGSDNVVIELTYAENPEALHRKQFTKTEIFFPVQQAAVIAAAMINASQNTTKEDAIMQVFVYGETPKAIAKRHFRKLRLFYGAEQAGEMATMIMKATEVQLDGTPKKVVRFY
jgi:hypothetical protein